MCKYLVVSLGYEGGCVYYANQLIKHFPVEKIEVWNACSTLEPFCGKSKKVRVYRGLWGQLLSWSLFLPYYIIKLIVGFIRHKYEKVLIFGPHNWDVVFVGISRLFRVPSFLVIHDGVMHLGEESKLHQALMNCEMRYASYWVFLSEFVHRRVAEHLDKDIPCIIIPHGIITYGKELRPVGVPDKFNLLLIGRINYYKGIHLLIEVLKELDFSKIGTITIAGSFDSSVDICQLERIAQVRIINKFLSNEEFDKLVKQSHLLLMPYLEASQSGIAAISLGYNIPAIVSRVGGIPEQLPDGAAYYMKDITADSLKIAIRNAVEQPELYLETKRNIKKRADELKWDVLSRKLFEYITENK